jgi:hypothetical protein
MMATKDIVKKENELRRIIYEQFKAKLLPTNMNSIELSEAQDERWYSWIAEADRTWAEIRIAMEAHWEQCRKEIAAAASNSRRGW